MSSRTVTGLVAALALATSAAPAAGQAEIVRLTVAIAPVTAAGAPIPVSVAVDADRGALSSRAGHLRLRVRYAAECAGTFAGTPGPVAIDARIPDPGAANATYHARLDGSAAVAALGSYSVCAYLEEEGTGRLFAQDSDSQFQATAACTKATQDATAAANALAAARRRLAHARGRRTRARLRRTVIKLAASSRAAERSRRSAC